jgi:cellulose synthase/poly-beta-1,6-N-acetylglucosamine synthase-like glycosyltransferase
VILDLDPARRPLSTICVVIPAFNEEKLVARCVSSVLAAGLAPSQVFVIDDASTDETRAALRVFDGVTVMTNPTRLGKSGGVARLLEQERLTDRFAFISLLDADSHVAPEYFETVLRTFDESLDVVLVCGTPRSERYNGVTAFRTLEYMLGARLYRDGQDAVGVITVAPGCASTYRSTILGELDWNGGTLVEDMDLTLQIHRQRLGTIRYAPDAIVFTQDPRRVRDYIGQITRWHSGTWQVMRRHGLPFGGQRIDAEFALLALEGLLYSLLILAGPVCAYFWPVAVLTWFLFDQLVMLVAAVACAVALRRSDVVMWYPVFSVFRFINALVLLRTFWREVVRGHTLQTWFSVGRYDVNGHIA